MHPRGAMWSGLANMFTVVAFFMFVGTAIATAAPLEGDSSMIDSSQDDLPNVSVPKSGGLVKQVKTQLVGDHRELGNVSATLLSVQSEVDQTEQSMLGKVLDLQTARNFFGRHEEINTANEKLEDEIQQLNTQIEGLSSTLSKVQKEFLTNALAYRKAEGKLHEIILEDNSIIDSIQAELAKEHEIKAALKRLTDIHEELMKDAKEAYDEGKSAVALLNNERSITRLEVGRHHMLRSQLVQMSNYSGACHASVERASRELGMMYMAESKDNQADAMASKQMQKAREATEQRLLAEHALLISEVKRIESEMVEKMSKVKDLREDIQTLEWSIAKETTELEAKIEAEKAQVKTLSAALLENTQAEDSDLRKKEALDAKITELVKQVHDEQNPVLVATIEGQNNALQAELNAGYELWRRAQESETSEKLRAETVEATVEAQQKGLLLAQKTVNTAITDGQERLSEAVAKATEQKKKAQEMFDKAQAAVAARCKPTWDSIWKTKRSQLVKCRSVKEELSMEKAKKETLEQTLKAATESNNA